ncbi:MAG: hypothetical protein ABI822_31640 [Bryobacteraceae bacterium]
MKHFTTALMLNLGVAGIYAQQHPVRMTFSGNGAPSAIDLKHPGANTVEENVAGIGTLGSFTFRDLRAAATAPQPSGTCAGLFFPTVAGGGIFQFQDGSLLKVVVKGGGDCIDLVRGMATCTLTLQITGGTGRFQRVTGGVLTYTETAVPVFFDGSGAAPGMTTETGDITGTISGMGDSDR